MRAKRMGDLLEDFLKDYRFEDKSNDIRVQEVFQRLFEDELGSSCQILGVNRGLLRLLVSNASESFHLMMKKTFFIHKVNQHLGEQLLKDIRIENRR